MNERGSQHYTAESYFKKESAQFAARWWWGLGSVHGGDGGGGDGGGRGGGGNRGCFEGIQLENLLG